MNKDIFINKKKKKLYKNIIEISQKIIFILRFSIHDKGLLETCNGNFYLFIYFLVKGNWNLSFVFFILPMLFPLLTFTSFLPNTAKDYEVWTCSWWSFNLKSSSGKCHCLAQHGKGRSINLVVHMWEAVTWNSGELSINDIFQNLYSRCLDENVSINFHLLEWNLDWQVCLFSLVQGCS